MRPTFRITLANILSITLTTLAFAVPPVGMCRINVDDTGPGGSSGTGCLIAEDLLLTNHHVIMDHESGQPIQILFADGTERVATIVDSHEEWDIALLKIDSVSIRPLVIGATPKVGSYVVTYGFGANSHTESPQSAKGKVKALGRPSKDGEWCWFEHYGKISKGTSGGPCIQDGKLVGVAWGCGVYGKKRCQTKLVKMYSVVAVGADQIKKFLKGNKTEDFKPIVYDILSIRNN
jgi:S1-C subfamily serine protease